MPVPKELDPYPTGYSDDSSELRTSLMPLYEYRCPDCSREFELLRPMDMSAARADCPSCGEPSTRILSVFAASTTGRSGESGPVAGMGGGGCGGGGCCGGACG